MEATNNTPYNAALRIQGRDQRIAEQSQRAVAMQAELESLRAENARLREALFSIEQSAHPDAKIPRTEYEWAMSLVCTARAALSEAS